MKGKMETNVGIRQDRALKITFLYQISSELRFTIFPHLWKNSAIFPISASTKKWKNHCFKIYDKITGPRNIGLSDLYLFWGHTMGHTDS